MRVEFPCTLQIIRHCQVTEANRIAPPQRASGSRSAAEIWAPSGGKLLNPTAPEHRIAQLHNRDVRVGFLHKSHPSPSQPKRHVGIEAIAHGMPRNKKHNTSNATSSGTGLGRGDSSIEKSACILAPHAGNKLRHHHHTIELLC